MVNITGVPKEKLFNTKLPKRKFLLFLKRTQDVLTEFRDYPAPFNRKYPKEYPLIRVDLNQPAAGNAFDDAVTSELTHTLLQTLLKPLNHFEEESSAKNLQQFEKVMSKLRVLEAYIKVHMSHTATIEALLKKVDIAEIQRKIDTDIFSALPSPEEEGEYHQPTCQKMVRLSAVVFGKLSDLPVVKKKKVRP
jgi:hypothetical protein